MFLFLFVLVVLLMGFVKLMCICIESSPSTSRTRCTDLVFKRKTLLVKFSLHVYQCDKSRASVGLN